MPAQANSKIRLLFFLKKKVKEMEEKVQCTCIGGRDGGNGSQGDENTSPSHIGPACGHGKEPIDKIRRERGKKNSWKLPTNGIWNFPFFMSSPSPQSRKKEKIKKNKIKKINRVEIGLLKQTKKEVSKRTRRFRKEREGINERRYRGTDGQR